MIFHAFTLLNQPCLNRRRMLRLAIPAILAGLLWSWTAAVQAQTAASPWISRLSGKHVVGDGVGHADGYTALEWFLPLNPNSRSTMLFADVSGLIFQHESYGANAGVGYRNYVPEQNRIYGINAYWDMRHLDGLLFNQAAVGFESLGEVVDFRVNGYTPAVNDASQTSSTRFFGHNLLYRELNALSGVDYECSVHLPDWRSIQSSVSAGGYHFDATNTPAATGWRARASVAFRDMIAAQFVVQDDPLFGRTYNVIVELRNLIRHRALARVSMDPLFRNVEGSGDGRTVLHRLGDPVRRQQNIVLARREVIAKDTTGTPLTFLHVVEGGTGDGTIENPYGSFTNAMADALAPSSITYTPRGGTFTDTFSLVGGAKVWSNGPLRQVASTDGSIVLPFSGRSGELTALPAEIIGDVTMADNTELSGFKVTGGIDGTGLTNVNLNQNNVDMAPVDAISFTNSTDVSLTDLLVTSSTGRGILLSDTDATVTRVQVNEAGDAAVEINTAAATPRTITIDTFTASEGLGEGIDVNAAGAGDLTLTMRDFTISGNDHAVDVAKTGAGDVILSLQNGTLNTDSGTGVRIDGTAGGGTLYVSQFDGIDVQTAATGGVVFDTVTFDANSTTAGNQTVVTETLNVGSSTTRTTGNGVSLTNTTGIWNMGSASIFNQNGVGLLADNSTIFSLITSSIDTLNGAALQLDTVEADLNFNTITSTDSTDHAIRLNAVSGEIVSLTTTLTDSVQESLSYENIPAGAPLTANFGATTINSTLGGAAASNIEKVASVDGLTEIYTPLTINFP